MKRLFATSVMVLAFAAAIFAQKSFNLYNFDNTKSADAVIKVLNNELLLTPDQFTKVRDLLYASAKGQAELKQNKDAGNTAQQQDAMVTRQTMHIEGNLKAILGEDKYKRYEAIKPTLEQKLKDLPKN
jgi:hypothetical protein